LAIAGFGLQQSFLPLLQQCWKRLATIFPIPVMKRPLMFLYLQGKQLAHFSPGAFGSHEYFTD
jgi:hypothetical protein